MANNSTPNSGQESNAGIELRKQAIAEKRAAQTASQTPAQTVNNNYGLALRAANRQAQRAAQPEQQGKYTFNGKSYSSQAEAKAAQDTYTKLAYYDFLSVGGDMNQFALMTRNKQGLANISDREWQYINKLSKTNASPTAYKKTATDQYLSQLGLPSEKDITKYRAKYAEYSALGGIQDRYKNLTEDELDFIKEQWDADTVRGLNGDRYLKNTKKDGTSVEDKEVKAPKYEDTLLDTELYENDLPPSAQMEIYHAQYLEKKKAEDDWKNAYNTSVQDLYKDAKAHLEDLREENKSKPEDEQRTDPQLKKEAFLDMFTEPGYREKYSDLYQYVTGDAVLPKKTDKKYWMSTDEDDPNYGKFDEGSSYYDDYRKALEKQNVVDGNRSLTPEKFEKWLHSQDEDERRQAYSKKYEQVREAGIKAMTEPAFTPEAKAKQKEAFQNYNLYFGEGNSGDFREVQWYFDSLNAGVPPEVCSKGIAEIDKWNKTENANNPKSFAQIQLALQGITPENDKEYKAKLEAITATKAETTKKGYTRNSEFNQQLYDDSIVDVRGAEAVPVHAAIYAKINGQQTGKLSDANTSDLYSKIYLPFFNYEGTGIGLASYMSEEEKKAFNSKYANSPERAMQYLDELYPLLVSRKETSGIDDFGQALKSGDMTETDYADYMYDYNIAQARSRIMQTNPESDEAYTTEAWRKYSGYSDQQLEYILEDAKQKLNDAPGASEDPEAYELANQEYQQTVRDITFVQDTRAAARENANVMGSVKDFTPEEGAKATAQVLQQMDDTGKKSILDKDGNKSKYFAAVNGIMLPSNADLEDDEYTWSERNDMEVASSMTKEEKDTFNWLFVNKGAEAADAYFRAMYSEFDARTAESIVAKNKEWAKKNPFNGILATVGSSLMYPVSGFSSLSGTISNGLSSLLGEETRLTRTQAAKWDFTNEWREGISEDWNFWGGFAYNTLMSMVDSGMAAGMNAVLPGFGEVALASTAFASTLRSGIDRGLDPNKATATALFAGLAEYVTEKIGLEQLVDLISGVGKTAGRKFLKDLLINTGKQALYEGSEELASELLNTFADNLINGDMSEFNQEVQSYINQGMSKDEAFDLAWGNWLKNAGVATLGGAISGGILAGGGTIGKRIKMRGNHPATVPHVNDYIKGSDIVSDRYGKSLSRNIQNALGTSETVDDQRRINGIINQLANIDKSSDLYSTVFDENGNTKLTREQQVALASALAYAGANADLDSMEAANTRMFAEQQSQSERRANTDYDSIKTPQALSQAKNQLEVLKKGIADRRKAIGAKLNEKRSAVQVAQADVTAKQQMWEMADLEGKKSAGEALSAATDKLKTARDALNTFMSGDYADNETAIKQSQEQIKEIQHALDKHYASYNAYLKDATADREEMQANYDNAVARVNALGEELDFLQEGYIAPNSAAEAWYDSVQDQMAEAQQEADIYKGWLNRSTPASLHDAIVEARNGNAAKYAKDIAEQRAGKKPSEQYIADNSESNAETAETQNAPQNAQQNTEQKAEEPKPVEQKRVVNIGKTAQNTIERTARRFGCEIVWSTRAELGANGKYDPKTPNKIYLAKDMLASRNLSTDAIVAREFFTHELVHYVRQTNTYTNLRDNALKYYESKYKGEGGARMVIDAIIEKERAEHNREFTPEQAKEELAAQFVQEALFAGKSTEQTLVWYAREDGNGVKNLLTAIQTLIKNGKVRNLSENNATRKLLEQSEHDLLKAIRERKRLDARGLSNSFKTAPTQTQTQTQTAPVQTQTQETVSPASETEQSVPEATEQEQAVQPVEQTETTAQETEESAPEQAPVEQQTEAPAEQTQSDLWNKSNTGDAPASVSDALGSVNPELAQLYNNGDPAVKTAVQNISKSVARGQVSPMAAATYLSQTFTEGGVDSLDGMFEYQEQGNPDSGILSQDDFFEVREIDDSHEAETSEQAEESPVEETPVEDANTAVTPREPIAETKKIFDMETADDYRPIDMSKSTITKADGTPYERLYHGGRTLGYGIENPIWADDHHSIFLTDNLDVAKSYTDANQEAVEYDPRTGEVERGGKKNENINWLSPSEMDNNNSDNFFKMVAYEAGANLGDIGKEATPDYVARTLNEELDAAISNAKNDGSYSTELWNAADDAVNTAESLVRMIPMLPSFHDETALQAFSDQVNYVAEANKALSPFAKAEYERVLSDPLFTEHLESERGADTSLLRLQKTLRGIESVGKLILDRGVFDAFQRYDVSGEGSVFGFDNEGSGEFRSFTQDEADNYMKTPENGVNGYYAANAYGEKTLHVDGGGRKWNMILPMSLPSDVQNYLADTYGYSTAYKTREVSRAARELGYDSIAFHDLVDIGSAGAKYGAEGKSSDIIIAFNPNQVKSVYNQNPTTRSHMMFSDGDTIADLVAKYGKKKQNTYAQQNNIVTPERTTDNNRVSDAVQTIKSVKTVSPEMRDMMDTRMLEEGMGVYNPVTLNKLRQQGKDYIAEKGGVSEAMKELAKDFRGANYRNVTKLISAANQVFTTIADENRTDIINSKEYADFVSDYIMMRSEWGRIGKAMQLVNDSPLARQTYWEKVVQKMNETNRAASEKGLRGMFGKNNFTPIKIPQYLINELGAAKTAEEINAAEENITRYIGENSPVTIAEYLRNWRYFSMLANPVTHARNMLGNLGMRGLVMQKNLIAAGMENAAVAMGLMDAEDRTHAFRIRYSPETNAAVKQLWAEHGDAVQSGGHEGYQQKVNDYKRKSPIRFIDKLMRFSGNSLESEDRAFLYWTFTDAAKQYIAAKGLDASNLTSQQKADIVSYATQQAQEATYRDASKFADMLNTISRSSTGARLAVESVMPFKKTPINIAKRGVNYSPYGIAKGLVQLGQNAIRSKQGNPTIPASAIIDQLAQGLTGTGVLALGMMLSRLGVLKLSAGNGDKDETFMRDIGHQDYSLELGDWSIKIESLAPMTFPLFMGAALDEALREQGATTDDEMSILEAAASVADPLMEMSFMSSINNALETYSSSKLGGIAENMVQSYIGQIFPTIGAKANTGGWISNIVDPYRRTTKASQKMSESVIGTNGDYWLRSIVNKIPFAKMALEPYVKTTGEYDIKDTFGDYVLANLNSFALPTNIQRIDSSPINEEIARLVSVTGNTEFVPQNPQKYMTLPNKAKYNMTAKEYTEYSKEYNEAVYAALTEAISSTRYLNATEDARIEMLEKAKKKAKDAVNKKYKVIFAERYAQGQGREE